MKRCACLEGAIIMSEGAVDLDHEPAQLDAVAGHAAVVARVRAEGLVKLSGMRPESVTGGRVKAVLDFIACSALWYGRETSGVTRTLIGPPSNIAMKALPRPMMENDTTASAEHVR